MQEHDLDQVPLNPPPCSGALRPLPRVADFAKAASPTLCFPPAARAGLLGFFGPATNQAEEKFHKNSLNLVENYINKVSMRLSLVKQWLAEIYSSPRQGG